MLLQPLLKKGDYLALKVRLASEGDLLASVRLEKLKSRFALFVAREAQSMLHHHLPDEVVLGVFDHAEAHNVKESVAIGVWHQRIGMGHVNQFLKAIAVEFLGGGMDR